MPTRNQQILITGVLIAAVVVAAVLIYVTWSIRSHGTISTLGLDVYGDPEGTIKVREIDWGRISQGGKSESQLYCKLTGNTPATFNFTTSNYVPEVANQYLVLTWDYDGAVLSPETLYPVKLTLTVSQSVYGFEDFSFDITIGATEIPSSE